MDTLGTGLLNYLNNGTLCTRTDNTIIGNTPETSGTLSTLGI